MLRRIEGDLRDGFRKEMTKRIKKRAKSRGDSVKEKKSAMSAAPCMHRM